MSIEANKTQRALSLALEALRSDDYFIHVNAIKALEAALEAHKALAKQEQRSDSEHTGEPVAWMWLFNGEVWDLSSVKDRYTAMSPSHVQVPLYTTPYVPEGRQQRTAAEGEDTRRAWVGLTDEELRQIWYDDAPVEGGTYVDKLRQVEAKLKEKNT